MLAAPVLADDEAANIPHVAVDRWGRCYTKSVPSGSYGSEGSTKVYRVEAKQDRLVDTYPWFSPRIHLECSTRMPDGRYAVAVVQFGPWARGQTATAEHLAIAFHAGGRRLRSYSTLDIAGLPERVSASVSHYTVIREVEGFVTVGGASVFRLVTVDGRRLTFDSATGELLSGV
jgi:hypothetical protein